MGSAAWKDGRFEATCAFILMFQLTGSNCVGPQLLRSYDEFASHERPVNFSIVFQPHSDKTIAELQISLANVISFLLSRFPYKL